MLELPKPSPLLACFLFCDRVWRMDGQSISCQACKAIALYDHHRCEIKPLVPDLGVADDEGQIALFSYRAADWVSVPDKRGQDRDRRFTAIAPDS
ncbi:hypothetical protein P6U16_23665 (plasmid) [Rhizobium sp. 32-5/1]|uniref:hypothetical protein n=1 Tax=Rhizobium sp. 32-5/1 TaxID=3019602 RepID=UPI00240E0547|nr:hypothetical protein [Rhizobium sp. 32-5/1]WEZ85964.1 hypothetical protein P6U16_23665 [Rhizobium sp. 32-5/1]